MSSTTSISHEALMNLERIVLLVMRKQFPVGFDESTIRGGHFQMLQAAAISLCKTQRLPVEMIHHILMTIDPTPCYRRLFVKPPQWSYVYHEDTPITLTEYDDDDDFDSDEDDEELRAWYDGEWALHDNIPYVSGRSSNTFYDSEEEELLFIGGKSIFAMYDREEAPAFFFDSEDEPLCIGDRSIFAEF